MIPTELTPGLPAVLRLLLACARQQMQAADLERASGATAEGVDWDRVIVLADAHGVLPLVAQHATSGCLHVPEAPLARLREKTNANARHSLVLAAEVTAIVRACAERHIAVLPLKGPVLAQSVYGSVALRQVRDLDFLIREADISAVGGLLERRGYRMDGAPEAWARRSSHHTSGLHPTKRVRVELHHYLVMPRGRRRWRLETIAPRLGTTDFMGVNVPAFTAEDQLVYLCEHGAGHAWSRLEWIATVAELMRGHVKNWERVWSWAGEWEAVHRVRAAMLLAGELLGERPPQGRIVAETWTSAANRAVVRRLIDEPGRIKATALESLVYQFRTDDTPAARLQRAWKTLVMPTSDDALAIDLPRPLRALYYVIRPFRLLHRSLAAPRA